MTKKFIKKPYESTVFFWCVARCVVIDLLLLVLIDACTGFGLVPAVLTPKLRRLARVSNTKRQKFDEALNARTDLASNLTE